MWSACIVVLSILCCFGFQEPQAIHSAHPLSQVRLFLHFDVNGTLILRDTSKRMDEHEAIIAALAAHTIASWDESPPMSFKEYVFTCLLPGDRSNRRLKQQRQEQIRTFMDWLHDHHHPQLAAVGELFHVIKQKYADPHSGRLHFSVFPSFYLMLNTLREQNIPFTILLRTFGDDLHEVVREIEGHPCGISFSHQARFDGPIFILDETSPTEQIDQIFDLIFHAPGHLAVQDDWAYWNRHKEQGAYGKCFIYDHSGCYQGKRNISVFFDDNITGKEQDIVNPCDISGNHLPKAFLYNRCLFPVDTVDAMLDDHYFIDRVMQAIHMVSQEEITSTCS